MRKTSGVTLAWGNPAALAYAHLAGSLGTSRYVFCSGDTGVLDAPVTIPGGSPTQLSRMGS